MPIPSSNYKPKVLVVGGGFAGIQIMKSLHEREDINLMLIDKKDFFFNNLGAPRCFVEPEFCTKLLIPYDNILQKKNTEDSNNNNENFQPFAKGEVVEIIAEENKLYYIDVNANKIQVNFDFLVLSNGVNQPFPFKTMPETNTICKFKNKIEQLADEVRNAKEVIVVGGGAVGVEVAGELGEAFGNKKSVTLVHSRPTLLSGNIPELPKEYRDFAQKQLEERNINVLLGEKVMKNEEFNKSSPFSNSDDNAAVHFLETTNNKKLQSDLTLTTVGNVKNTVLFEEKTNKNGSVQVNEWLQVLAKSESVEGVNIKSYFPNIFCVGDASDCCNENLATHATFQGQYLGKLLSNLFDKMDNTENGNIIKGSFIQNNNLAPYEKWSKQMKKISVGKNGSIIWKAAAASAGAMATIKFHEGTVDWNWKKFWDRLNMPIPK